MLYFECPQPIIESAQLCSYDEDATGTSIAGLGITERTLITEIKIGTIRYKLLTPLHIIRDWLERSQICWAEGLSDYHGKGDTISEAEQNFKESIHLDFQRLYRKRPFEMDESERKRWRSLLNVIDVLHYRQTTPLSLREIGCVSYGRLSYPTKIEWIDGRIDSITFDMVPPELVECRTGQWIETIVKRNPVTKKLICIDHIQKIKSIHIPKESPPQEEWESMPRADLAESEWNWPKG